MAAVAAARMTAEVAFGVFGEVDMEEMTVVVVE